MAAINVFLDSRRAIAGGLFPIKFSIFHNGKQRNIPTGIAVALNQWKEGKIVSHPQRVVWNNLIMRRLTEFNDALVKVAARRVVRLMSCEELKNELIKELDPLSAANAEASPDFLACLTEFTQAHKKPRTQGIYVSTMSSIRKYLASLDPAPQSLTFRDINRKWLSQYEQWMEAQGNMVNTRSIHLRNIRAVFNYAIKEDVIGMNSYPFRHFSIKQEATVKRSLSMSDMRTLLSFKPQHKFDTMAHDVFCLIFYLIGINIIDLYHLEAKNYNNGRITYRRSKTGRIYDIKVLPEAAELIEKYRASDSDSNGRLLFFREYDSYMSLRAVVNDHLKVIAKQLSIPPVTTYWARHSWATFAAELDIPKETISAALGHGGDSVTDVYIDFNLKKVDEANARVVAAVKPKRDGTMTLEEELALRSTKDEVCPF